MQDRIKRYQAKLKKLADDEELASRRATMTLDVGAANRFIDAAIPDLTGSQRANLKKVLPGHGDPLCAEIYYLVSYEIKIFTTCDLNFYHGDHSMR